LRIRGIIYHRRAVPAGQRCAFHPEAKGAVPILWDTIRFYPVDFGYATHSSPRADELQKSNALDLSDDLRLARTAAQQPSDPIGWI